MPNLKKILFILFFGITLTFPLITFAGDQYYGLDSAATQAGLQNGDSEELPTMIGNIIGSILALIGVTFFALMVYGGFLWMTAHGDSGQVDKGRETIIAAVIGMIVVVASYALTAFILTAPIGETQPKKPNLDDAYGCCIVEINVEKTNVENQTAQSCQTYCEEIPLAEGSPEPICTFYDFDANVTPDREAEFCNGKL